MHRLQHYNDSSHTLNKNNPVLSHQEASTTVTVWLINMSSSPNVQRPQTEHTSPTWILGSSSSSKGLCNCSPTHCFSLFLSSQVTLGVLPSVLSFVSEPLFSSPPPGITSLQSPPSDSPDPAGLSRKSRGSIPGDSFASSRVS